MTRHVASLRATVDSISLTADDVELASITTDDEQQLFIPAALLPAGTRPGDVLVISIARDEDETRARAARIADLQRKLFG